MWNRLETGSFHEFDGFVASIARASIDEIRDAPVEGLDPGLKVLPVEADVFRPVNVSGVEFSQCPDVEYDEAGSLFDSQGNMFK